MPSQWLLSLAHSSDLSTFPVLSIIHFYRGAETRNPLRPLRLRHSLTTTLLSSCFVQDPEENTNMKMTASLGNPVLIFLYSLAILLLGCAIGLHWKGASGTACWLAALGALLMVIHD